MAARKKPRKKPTGYSVPKASEMALKEPMLAEPVYIRKNMDIDAVLLASARKALGAATDTEAVNRALAEVSRSDEILSLVDALRDAGGLDDVFGHLDA